MVSVYLPTWPTDRFRRQHGGPPPSEPLVTALSAGSARRIGTACAAAQALGLNSGLPIAQAQARIPNLHIIEAAPEGDEAALGRLAQWAIAYSPIVAVDPPDGIWIDIAGVAHLFGSEEKLLEHLLIRFTRQGITAKAAIADAPGTAWAVARFRGGGIIPVGRSVEAVATLPVASLRLPRHTVATMHKLGVERVGQLAAMPRAPMVRRFGNDVALRLDQAMGHAFEPINPLIPEETAIATRAFAEPISRLEYLQKVVRDLAEDLCRQLVKRGQGVRRLDLILRRVDEKGASLRVGTAKATREHAHLAKLFDERLQTIDPGFGIEEMVLVASKVEPFVQTQTEARGIESGSAADVDLSRLVDRLSAKVGSARVYRLAPVQTLIPERMAKRILALAPPTEATWPETLPRPTRLLDPPEPVVSTALLPDHPPVQIIWRKIRHKVVRADGPERIAPEWWAGDPDRPSRDYYRIETDQGGRFWVFRDAPTAEGGRWWMHGFFG
ncbi:DNA polymerase Y family protein [Microvirga sp. BSC39]|uniref:Y-family DNA polymerase n=1 Tax=Microvirga sp. BSC39 TaxID=1549810 RepID=UPI0032999065